MTIQMQLAQEEAQRLMVLRTYRIANWVSGKGHHDLAAEIIRQFGHDRPHVEIQESAVSGQESAKADQA